MATSILFVDDNENILQGLRRTLRGMRQWETRFALGGDEAIKTINAEHIDVIVSDIRMPKTDGSELLLQIKKSHPGTVRVVLSGQCEEAVALKLLEVSHQYMAKPCDVNVIINTITPIITLREKVIDNDLRSFLTGISSLPTLPKIYDSFMRELSTETPNKKTLEEIAARDISMTLKLLQIMNSSYFGPSRDIVALGYMWELLSIDKVQFMMSQNHLVTSFPAEYAENAFLQKLWDFACYAAQISKMIALSEGFTAKMAEKAYISGMLQAAGIVSIYEYRRRQNLPIDEKNLLNPKIDGGDSYVNAGAYLLCLWGLQKDIVSAIQHHIEPAKAPDDADKNFIGIIHVATALARARTWPDMTGDVSLDFEFLKSTGAFDKLRAWQDMARGIR